MAKIFVYDEFAPEDIAMMQALYSRSPKSVTEHVEQVKQTGSGKFMERFYVGYGHASIADCGSTTIFIEGISILGDKAIQDWPFYSGQETSTRYVDMAKRPIVDPIGTGASKKILDKWMAFYAENLPLMERFLTGKYPKKESDDENVYKKAIKARAFDILRAFLPAGITTQLSWHTNLRQAWDKLSILRYHPLDEVRTTAESILAKLKEKYPHSFSHRPTEEQESYREYAGKNYFLFNPPKEEVVEFSLKTDIKKEELEKYKDITENRPPRTGLPIFLFELGILTFDLILDYGSFRDLHRHRNGICRVPLLRTDIGFNPWYLEELPADIKEKALKLIEEQKETITKLNAPPEILQYYIALGFNVPCHITYGLPATVYVVELRCGKMVHPTLRKIAFKMREALLDRFPNLKMNCDLEPSEWDVSRGLQDIIKK
ncbi:MAG: FAD-dependent thymidylate synthase [Patescibacteria group bacterium]